MPMEQTLLAVLSGGPYGPSDGAGMANRSLILRSCRADGVLLRVDKPATMVDRALLATDFTSSTGLIAPKPVHVWSTFSDIGDLRWGYVPVLPWFRIAV